MMDRSLQHAEWITEVQWYYPHVYQSPGFRRLTTLVKHKRVTLWPGATGYPRISVRELRVNTRLLLVVQTGALFPKCALQSNPPIMYR